MICKVKFLLFAAIAFAAVSGILCDQEFEDAETAFRKSVTAVAKTIEEWSKDERNKEVKKVRSSLRSVVDDYLTKTGNLNADFSKLEKDTQPMLDAAKGENKDRLQADLDRLKKAVNL
ncbi:uncharacterized protein [Periplaneta americana]|uniref:uncharacterized protein n=1 Tax=Periplaneta americana TaxID=6978 RepID=UPI0037E87A31